MWGDYSGYWVWDPATQSMRPPVQEVRPVVPPPDSPNPDERRSESAMFIEEREDGVCYWVLQVKGMGAICLRASTDVGASRYDFMGLSTFTNSDIGKDL